MYYEDPHKTIALKSLLSDHERQIMATEAERQTRKGVAKTTLPLVAVVIESLIHSWSSQKADSTGT